MFQWFFPRSWKLEVAGLAFILCHTKVSAPPATPVTCHPPEGISVRQPHSFPQVNLYSVYADAKTVGPSLPYSFSWFSEGTSALGVHEDLLIRHWYFKGNQPFLSSNDFPNLCSQCLHFSLGYVEFIFNRLSRSDIFIEDFWLHAYPRKVFCPFAHVW